MSQRNLILFDDQAWTGLLPLTWLRPVCELRLGASTIRERWEALLDGRGSALTQDHLTSEFPPAIAEDNYFINASVLPTEDLVADILTLDMGQAIVCGDDLLAARLSGAAIEDLAADGEFDSLDGHEFSGGVTLIRRPHDLFLHNGAMIRADVARMTQGRHFGSLSSTNTIIGEGGVFAEEGVSCEAAVLNTHGGPIYLGAGATVMEGALLRGPLVVGPGATVKMGAKIYGDTTVGPGCKVGGEVTNVVFQGNSNKGHDGYLGNAVIGQWCNLGADTNCSNLKNNYTEVRLWDYETERFEPTGRQFCGLIMGDHAKCGINTMFNTGTVVGVGANVFGDGFPRAFVPDFAWGGAARMSTYRLESLLETAELVMVRRGASLTEGARESLKACFELTAKHRRWEKATAAETNSAT